MKQLEKLGNHILDLIDYFFTHLGDEQFMFKFLAICTLILALSVFMVIRQFTKKGGVLDIQGQEFADWEPFHFIEDYLGIDIPTRISFADIFRHGRQQDYFFTQVAKKLYLPEYKQYHKIREKIKVYENKWMRLLFALPILVLVIHVYVPLSDYLEHFLTFGLLGLLFFCIIKLQSKPYKDELIPVQIRIIEKMYRHLFKQDFPKDITFDIILTKVNKIRVPSHYIDVAQVIEQIKQRTAS